MGYYKRLWTDHLLRNDYRTIISKCDCGNNIYTKYNYKYEKSSEIEIPKKCEECAKK